VQLVPILDIDLDPSRRRLMLAGGSRDGVRMGQPVIDAGGVVGQIIGLTPTTSTVLLLTDPGHAMPVEVARSGVRLIVAGNGRSDQLTLQNVPLSGDVRVGDTIVTSGLGARFPAGFAVGTVTALRPDDSRAFLVGEVRPSAQLDRGRDVLLLREGAAAARPVAFAPAVAPPGAEPGAQEAAADAAMSATAFGTEAFERPAPPAVQAATPAQPNARAPESAP
jgi:rod shape-determining protein MreC